MPLSTNAPFNELGHAQVLRDIEQLYLKLQELNNANTAQGGGDLNPGGGAAVSQQVPEDSWGPPAVTPDGGGGGLSALAGLIYASGSAQALAGAAALTVITSESMDTLGGFNASAGIFIAPAAGIYHLSLTGSVAWNSVGLPIAVGLSIQPGSSPPMTDGFNSLPVASGNAFLGASGVRRLLAGEAVSLVGAGSVSGGGSYCSLDADSAIFSAFYLGSGG